MSRDAERLRGVIETQRAITEAGLAIDDVMKIIAEQAQTLTGARMAAVELAEGDEMVYRAATGTAVPHLGSRFRLHGSLSGLAVRTAEALVCADALSDDRVDAETSRRIGIRSIIVAPLLHAGGAIGVLEVGHDAPGSFDGIHVELLELLAGFVAAAIVNARRFGEHAHDATHDALTGLPNRELILDRVAGSLARSERRERLIAMFSIDLDGFDQVNERLGHAGGDEALRVLAQRIRKTIRGGDTAARIGGDEFVVLAELLNMGDVDALRDRIEAAVCQPILVGGEEVSLSATVGTATAQGPERPESLMSRAEAAMHSTKAAKNSS